MKVLIAMSGGVDSAVAAKLILDGGNECVGCTMKLYTNEDAAVSASRTCCSLDDTEDAKSVARRLGFPHYVFNFTDEFRAKVIDKFIDSYLHGKTPNPCIDCNRHLKFEKLFVRAAELGCDAVATGHYARIEKNGDKYVLKKALDPAKDQSYVLYSLTQEQLARTLFPLGNLSKPETRKIAEESGFTNAAKPDSQDICFVPDGDYARVIEARTGKTFGGGNFVDLSGNVIGQHKGIIHYTVGQRKGLGIAFGEPTYVCRVCPETGDVVLGKNEDLFAGSCDVTDFNWISGEAPTGSLRCKVKIRYRQKETPATVTSTGDGSVHIEFDEKQRAVTPGQAAVLYDGDVVLGGGTIVR